MSNSFGPGVSVMPGAGVEVVDTEGWLWLREHDYVVVRATVKDHHGTEGKLAIAMQPVEAINLAGRMMMAPEEVIEAQRQVGELTGGYSAAFAEVANLMCCDAESVMRANHDGEFSIRFDRFGSIRPGFDLDSMLDGGEHAIFDFTVRVGEAEATPASVLLDLGLAESWNDQVAFADEESAGDVLGEQEIPQAPICAKLAAYVVDRDLLSVVNTCARRLGLEIQTYSRNEIPNPDAHRGQIVLLEVPVGDVKRFDWAKRIKQKHDDIQVVLLIAEPSRTMVRLGFLTKADVVAAWPCPERQLSAKLTPLVARLNP